MAVLHKTLDAGGWQALSLAEQMGNIGSEVNRALNWRGKDPGLYEGALDWAFELIDFTIQDFRWRGRLKELTRVREMFCDAIFGGQEYGSSLEELNSYFLGFALAARLHILA